MVASMVIDARERVEDFVSRYGGPNGASLTEDIHVFYFAVDLEDSPVILLNRNGNHVRLVKDERGWSVYPMWSREIIGKSVFGSLYSVESPKGLDVSQFIPY